MNTKWTPGLWVLHIEKDGGNWRYEVRTAEPHNPAGGLGKHIATVNPSALLYPEHTGSLLAAAPAMYEALERIANHEYRTDRRHRGMIDISEIQTLERIARVALAAARGESE